MNKDASNATIRIDPVINRRSLKAFIDVPWRIYADDENWVPPLRLERRLHLSSFNPYMKNAIWQGWVAYVDNRPVGRISAQIDHIHQKHFGNHSGQFGFIEGINDPQIFRMLFDACEQWLADHGITYITGPFNFSINQECGVLVEGFESPPVVLMPHSRQWYGPIIEDMGYRPAIDLLAYWIDEKDFGQNPVMQRLVNRFASHVKIRPMNKSKFKSEMETMRNIFNDAWSNNWGFIPFDKKEFADLGTSLRPFVPEGYIQIAEIDDNPVAFLVVLPNLNEVLRELNGKLLPFGWIKMIRAVRNNKIKTARVPLMGVRKEYQNSPIGLAMAYMMCAASRNPVVNSGITGGEMSWILENNKGMRSMLKNLSAYVYKRYRIYEKQIQ